MFSWCSHFLPILGVNVFCFSVYSLISGLFQFNTGGVVVVWFFYLLDFIFILFEFIFYCISDVFVCFVYSVLTNA